jgi:murein L,D-transpeptidase YafK
LKKGNIVIVAAMVLGVLAVYKFYKINIDIKEKSFESERVVKEKDIMCIEKEGEVFFMKPETKPQNVNIKIYKEARRLELHGDDKLIGVFKIAIGGAPFGEKNKEGDKKTPEGKYYICTRNDKSKYNLFLGISYPNAEDALRGLENGLIDEVIYREIKIAIENHKRPSWDTPLGGAVGIHGGGASRDWTLGCIAVSDEDIEIIWEYTKMNTPVEIYK